MKYTKKKIFSKLTTFFLKKTKDLMILSFSKIAKLIPKNIWSRIFFFRFLNL